MHQPDTSTPGKEIKPRRKSGLINCILLFGGGGVIKYIWEASAVPAVNTAIYIKNGGSEEVWNVLFIYLGTATKTLKNQYTMMKTCLKRNENIVSSSKYLFIIKKKN